MVCACREENDSSSAPITEGADEISSTKETKSAEEKAAEQWEKGYDLPVDEQEEKNAEDDCKKMMALILGIYEYANKGNASNVVLNDEAIFEVQNKIKDTGCPVATTVAYFNMEN